MFHKGDIITGTAESYEQYGKANKESDKQIAAIVKVLRNMREMSGYGVLSARDAQTLEQLLKLFAEAIKQEIKNA